ncbi:sensor histidine kinase [Leucobacter weissii]|uniref:histidine kinase n=1 Tax=Leucobacter weissii TaxID=1983706 RepID=A0A939MPF5_9MICO|nr:sensor histidine kinase [Leucobacter weissii]MBO1902181.1 sensor histidine kinase [Leucobacter weissii]
MTVGNARAQDAEEPREARSLMALLPVQAALYLGLAVVFAALGLSGMWDVFSVLLEPVPAWWGLATAIPSSALVLLKRRAPGLGLGVATALFLLDLLTVGGIVPMLVMLELLHALIVELSAEGRRRVLVAVAAATLLFTAAALLRSADARIALMVGIPFGALLGFSYWYANSVAQSRELVRLYRQRAEDASRLAELDRTGAVREERERMARELHDVVAGHVAAVAIRSEAALTGPGAEAAGVRERDALRAVRDASLEAHGALRSMIAVLRGGSDHPPGPVGRDDVPRLVAEAERSGVRVDLADRIGGALGPAADHALGRVVQEALVNCVRHASGSLVEVRLCEEGDSVVASIVSRGGEPRVGLVGSGAGLEMLAERVRATGGVFEAGAEGERWAVRARLPREALA